MPSRAHLKRCLASAAIALLAGPLPAWAADELPPGDEAAAHYLYDQSGESPVDPVAFERLQQPGDGMSMVPPRTPPRPAAPARRGPSGSRQGNIRLASVPNMFGDVFLSSGRVFTEGAANGQSSVFAGGFEIPAAGGSRRVKIGENNKALPDDRIFFMYNHFHNALSIDQELVAPPGPRIVNQAHVDRYTLGFEKMFFDDLWSCEVRMPFVSSFDARTDAFGVDGGSIGNLAVILKNLLYVDESCSVVVGVGLDTPTGSDFDATVGLVNLTFENNAFHVLPYVGFLYAWDDLAFVTGFAQIDIAANGNEVVVVGGQQPGSLGYLTEQNLAFFDIAAGFWLYKDPDAERLTSIALMGELHYTTTIQDSDLIDATVDTTPLLISNPYNRQDILNATIALQAEIANTTNFRVAGVFPLGEAPDERFFDAEVQVQINRRF